MTSSGKRIACLAMRFAKSPPVSKFRLNCLTSVLASPRHDSCGRDILNFKTWPKFDQPRRDFTHWLNMRFNAVDHQRIQDVGYDRATAEWCLRVGASVKWLGKDELIRDYNSLPVGQFRSLKVEAIDATDSGIMHAGFEHLKGLQHFNKLILVNCIYITNGSLISLTYNAQSLEWLEVVNCGDVTGGGLKELVGLPNLKYLRLEKLAGVEKPKPALEFLRAGLPNCEIEYPDAEDETA